MFKTGDGGEMGCVPSELRLSGVSGERVLWVYWTSNLASGGLTQTDRMTVLDHCGSFGLALQLER